MYENYIYNSVETLNVLDNINSFPNVNICCYRVHNNDDIPFLTYLLQINNKKTKLNFPCLPNRASLHNDVYDFFGLNINSKIVFKGFKVFNNELYSFYELKSKSNPKSILKINTDFYFCLLHEIVNIQLYQNTDISTEVTHFFTSNSSFCFLFDMKNNILETPIIAYKMHPLHLKQYLDEYEILLEHDYNFYELYLEYITDFDKNNCYINRYAVFIKSFVTLKTVSIDEVQNELQYYDSILTSISNNSKILCKNKSHIVSLNMK